MEKKLISAFWGMVLVFLAGCGGGGDTGIPSSSLVAPLAAPLLFESDEGIVIKIPRPYIKCSYRLHVINEANEIEYEFNGDYDFKYLNRDDGKNVYFYTCSIPNGEVYKSRVAKLRDYEVINLGYYGPMSISDFNRDGFYELLGKKSEIFGFELIQRNDLGLSRMNDAGRSERDIRFADFDNDGNLDAIANVYSENIGEGEVYNNYIQLYWGTNDGKFILDEEFSKKKYTGYGETIVVADLDNDEFLDILIPQYRIANSTNKYSRNLVFKNLKNRSFQEVGFESGLVNGKQIYPEGAQALDFNGDGLIDLYVGGSLFLNKGRFSFYDVTDALGLPGIFDEGIKFFDYDLDGDFDFVINTSVTAPEIFINKGGFFVRADRNLFPSEFYLYNYGLQLADWNGDGFEDLLLAGGVDENLKNIGPRFYLQFNGEYVRQNLLPDDGSWSDLVSFADFDNNGSFDMALRYGSLRVVVNKNIPKSFVKVDVVSNGVRNQHGRSVKAYYPDGRIKIIAIDGGSGYMSNLPYTLNIPNDGVDEIRIEVFCKNKTKVINVSGGSHEVDCAK